MKKNTIRFNLIFLIISTLIILFQNCGENFKSTPSPIEKEEILPEVITDDNDENIEEVSEEVLAKMTEKFEKSEAIINSIVSQSQPCINKYAEFITFEINKQSYYSIQHSHMTYNNCFSEEYKINIKNHENLIDLSEFTYEIIEDKVYIYPKIIKYYKKASFAPEDNLPSYEFDLTLKYGPLTVVETENSKEYRSYLEKIDGFFSVDGESYTGEQNLLNFFELHKNYQTITEGNKN